MNTSEIKTSHGSWGSYVIGYILSLVLTAIPFLLVTQSNAEGWMLLLFLVGFAVLQLMVQLVFFLHIGKGADAKWNVTAFAFMIFFVLIVVVGSLWVMHHLNYNMMGPNETDTHMQEEAQKGF